MRYYLYVYKQESSEASEQNKSTLANVTKDEVRLKTKVNRRLNGKTKNKKGKKRKRDSSDEDNFSLEHFRRKKRSSKKGIIFAIY